MVDFFSSAAFIHLGAIFYIIGFLVRDELLLRIFVMTGNTFYILYYFMFPEEPLWDAIITSSILGAVNSLVIARIVLERTTFALNEDEKTLYGNFNTLNPGQFRKVLNTATSLTIDQEQLLCHRGEKAKFLYFLFSGEATVKRESNSFNLVSGCFLGEIAFVTDGNYTADVTAKQNARVVTFGTPALKKKMAKNQSFSNSMISLFNIDMARKLSVSNR